MSHLGTYTQLKTRLAELIFHRSNFQTNGIVMLNEQGPKLRLCDLSDLNHCRHRLPRGLLRGSSRVVALLARISRRNTRPTLRPVGPRNLRLDWMDHANDPTPSTLRAGTSSYNDRTSLGGTGVGHSRQTRRIPPNSARANCTPFTSILKNHSPPGTRTKLV